MEALEESVELPLDAFVQDPVHVQGDELLTVCEGHADLRATRPQIDFLRLAENRFVAGREAHAPLGHVFLCLHEFGEAVVQLGVALLEVRETGRLHKELLEHDLREMHI